MTPRQRGMIILPICLLLFNIIEEFVVYYLPRFVPNPYTRAAVLIILFAIGFTMVGDFLVPWVAGLFDHGHKTSQREAGRTGVVMFYVISFAVLYFIYFLVYCKSGGVKNLIPPFMR